MESRHHLTVLLYNAAPNTRHDLEDFLFDKFEENPGVMEWLGSGGFADGSVQDIALTTQQPEAAFSLLKEWLREYPVPNDTEISLSDPDGENNMKFSVYEDD